MVVVEEDEAVLLNEMVGEDSLEAVEGVAVPGDRSLVGLAVVPNRSINRCIRPPWIFGELLTWNYGLCLVHRNPSSPLVVQTRLSWRWRTVRIQFLVEIDRLSGIIKLCKRPLVL